MDLRRRIAFCVFLAAFLFANTGCAFVYYRESVVLTLPGGIEAPEPGAYESVLNGRPADLTALLYELEKEDVGAARAEAFLEAVRDARITLYVLTRGKAPFPVVLREMIRVVYSPRRDKTPGEVPLMDIAAVFEGRNRECLPLTLAYLVVGRQSGLRLYPVITRGHMFVMYSDGVNSMYVDVTRNILDADCRRLAGTCFGTPYAPAPYLRPLTDGQLAALILANRAVEIPDTAAALRDIQAAIVLFPELPLAWVNKGVLLEKAGRLQDAKEAYERAVGLDPDNDYAVYGLARLMLDPENGDGYDPRRAQAMLQRALEGRAEPPGFLRALLDAADKTCNQVRRTAKP